MPELEGNSSYRNIEKSELEAPQGNERTHSATPAPEINRSSANFNPQSIAATSGERYQAPVELPVNEIPRSGVSSPVSLLQPPSAGLEHTLTSDLSNDPTKDLESAEAGG